MREYESVKFETLVLESLEELAEAGEQGWEIKGILNNQILLQRACYDLDEAVDQIEDGCKMCRYFEGAYKMDSDKDSKYVVHCPKIDCMVNEDHPPCPHYERVTL